MKDKKSYLQDVYLLMSRLKRQVDFLEDGLLVEYVPVANHVNEIQRYIKVLKSCERASRALDDLCDCIDLLRAV